MFTKYLYKKTDEFKFSFNESTRPLFRLIYDCFLGVTGGKIQSVE